MRCLRIANREKRDYEETLAETCDREESEQRRFQEFYGIEVSDTQLFDLIINTERWNAVETINICIAAVKAYIASSGMTIE